MHCLAIPCGAVPAGIRMIPSGLSIGVSFIAPGCGVKQPFGEIPVLDDSVLEKYEQFEELFDPTQSDRQARRSRRIRPPGALGQSWLKEQKELAELAETEGLEGGFQTTYRPSKHEAGWLLDSLRGFYDQSLITDVLALVRGGKEANVYRCAAHPSAPGIPGTGISGSPGESFLAAKVYRPRRFRSLSNDAMYKEGRVVLTAEGNPVGLEAERVGHAINKKTVYGRQVAHTSWLMYEHTTLLKLSADGAAVPKPFAAADNALLMSYIGDAGGPAPALSEVGLAREEIGPLFREVMRNVELMLGRGLIHGDLSAYNILYHAGRITLIDFPQVADLHGNSNARLILNRDLTRVCDYFQSQGFDCDPDRIADRLWRRYRRMRTPKEIAADESRMAEEA